MREVAHRRIDGGDAAAAIDRALADGAARVHPQAQEHGGAPRPLVEQVAREVAAVQHRRDQVRRFGEAWHAMWEEIARNRFTPQLEDRDAAIAAYERHNADVRVSLPSDRLVDWQPGDGWEPICEVLDLPVPDQPFPHVNTTADFRAMFGWE